MSETVRRPVDRWNESAIMAAEEATVRDQAQLLELRGRGEDQAAIREAYLDVLGVASGEHVLDLGCGTGVVARAAARRVGPNGRVVALDPSEVMLAFGREIAEREGLLDRIEFQAGDARELPFSEAAFDIVLAITALSHTTDAERALPELLRVARPGGRIGIFDIDNSSWIIAHPDQDLTRRIGVVASMSYRGGERRDLPGGTGELGGGLARRASREPFPRGPHPSVHLGAPSRTMINSIRSRSAGRSGTADGCRREGHESLNLARAAAAAQGIEHVRFEQGNWPRLNLVASSR